MNSYPSELLCHLYPMMFVAGLERWPSKAPAEEEKDAFFILANRLRETLNAQRPSLSVWNNPERKFNIILVDKDVRFPPRKSPSTHSPLSPLTNTSPLYPDGLIAPVWLRKHLLLVPSVLVLFLRLTEPQFPTSPLEPTPPASHLTQEDSELANEIGGRKRACADRGIKLTVVLMTSRRMLDDPSLDTRLTFIRRQSGLDSRASLFVLSPVSPAELNEFINSLQGALLSSAIEYYTAHSKRVRRKRGSMPSLSAIHPHSAGPLLSPAGWHIRYEFKQACFAELRGENEVALKHYLQTLHLLHEYFTASHPNGSFIIAPRTKRWAEAKVLADCVAIKILAHHLSPPAAPRLTVSHFNSHIQTFSDFLKAWGMDESGWEFWSWRARQYRILADLLTTSPSPVPLLLSTSTSIPSSSSGASRVTSAESKQSIDQESLESQGLNPATQLQHPGIYYYTAAECTLIRRQRFVDATVQSGPSYANEQKVDHFNVALELYTKAYDLFKTHSAVDGTSQSKGTRLTFFVASKIAEVYCLKGENELAMKFLSRIARSYRSELFTPLLRKTLRIWLQASQSAGDVESGVKVLLEMISRQQDRPELSTEKDVIPTGELIEDLMVILKSTSPSVSPFAVDPVFTASLFRSSITFYHPQVHIDGLAPFQILIEPRPGVDLSAIPFESLSLELVCSPSSQGAQPVTKIARIRHTSSSADNAPLRHVPLSVISFEDDGQNDFVCNADLSFPKDTSVLLSGNVSSHFTGKLEIVKSTFTIKEGNWTIDCPINLSNGRFSSRWFTSLEPLKSLILPQEEPAVCAFHYEPHSLGLELVHEPEAYLDEEFNISLVVTNEDDRDFECFLDVLLHPAEETADNTILIDDQSSSSLIQGVSFGILRSGEKQAKSLVLRSSGPSGPRLLDISVRSQAVPSVDTEDADSYETLKTLTVPTSHAIGNVSRVTYHRVEGRLWSDLSLYDPEAWHTFCEARVCTTLTCDGESIEILSIKFASTQENRYTKAQACSLEPEDFPLTLMKSDEFSIMCPVLLSRGHEEPSVIPSAGTYEITWRRTAPGSKDSTSIISMPLFNPPSDNLVALLHVPPVATLHLPFTARLSIQNDSFATAELSIQIEPSENFVVSGLRSGRLSTLIPGNGTSMLFNLIPLTCGPSKIPQIKVTDHRRVNTHIEGGDRREAPEEDVGRSVRVIDARSEGRLQEEPDEASSESTSAENGTRDITVLVVP
ncbi:hypothetical protein SISSUDRAFT_1064673 [Sistotremastrum suecicum HHB10207 ss-3]|uniref:Uncharacterized protein n=1 Tax=Sistotremastrum suecicum HHB10207 ss-3 TaxID=1314776 RepID=A0A166ACY6_9AGAM|nr:hypothetical protein SISSUDRAFT_1064673 [Sistotremastrum suecicum HHB10207 ss-3]